MTTRIERALITGASSGIGEEFARQLAARGVPLTLVARRRERLEHLAAELDVDAEVMPANLTDPGDRDLIEQRLGGGDDPVDLLVNNAGLGGAGDLTDLGADRQATMVELNAVALMRLTRAAVDALRPRGRGGVINVGSTAGFQPNPHGATYGASKAFVDSFTQAVAEELRGEPVRVMLLCPGFTDTEFHGVAGNDVGAMPDALRMSPASVVATGLRDFARGRTTSVPGVLNSVTARASDVSPSAVSRRISGLVHQRLAGPR